MGLVETFGDVDTPPLVGLTTSPPQDEISARSENLRAARTHRFHRILQSDPRKHRLAAMSVAKARQAGRPGSGPCKPLPHWIPNG